MKMNNPAGVRISVVVVTLNRAASLERCLSSLARQEVLPEEVVIVDNGSSDNTAEVAASYCALLPLKYLREEKPDVAYARNTGIKASSGDVVAFTDDDCVVNADWVKNIAASYGLLDFDIIGGKVLNAYQNSLICRLWQDIYLLWFNCLNILSGKKDNCYEFPAEKCAVKTLMTNNISYLRKIFDLDEGFRPGLSMNEDAELHYRLRGRGYRILYDPAVTVSHHYRNSFLSMWRALYVSGRGLFFIGRNRRPYNCLLELGFAGRCGFILRLLFYPFYLLRKKRPLEALMLLPFFVFREAAVFCGFLSAVFLPAGRMERRR